MKKILVLLCCTPFAALAQTATVLSGAYQWQQPVPQKNKLHSIVLSEGRVHDFEWMQLTATALAHPRKKCRYGFLNARNNCSLLNRGYFKLE